MSHEQSPQPNDDAFLTAMRAETESDRSAEFKAGRNELVHDINDWLRALAVQLDAGRPARVDTVAGSLHMPFLETPRRVTTLLGISGNICSVGENTSPGIWLGGDGHTEPYQLQALVPGESLGSQKFISVRGTDPTAAAVYGDSFDGRPRNETVTSLAVEYNDPTGLSNSDSYSIEGSGAVRHTTYDLDGVSRSGPVRDRAGIEMAQRVFAEQIAAVLPAN